MRRIMLITSKYTGHGHMSITEALMEQFTAYPDLEVDVVEGFSLIGRVGVRASKMYGTVTRNAVELWKLTWDVTVNASKLGIEMLSPWMHDRFMQHLAANPPDLILSVHPLFNGTLLDILEQYKIDIPLVSLLADIVDIHPLWMDRRALSILCPTQESLEACVRCGIPADKLVRCGFPTRARFTDAARAFERKPYTPDRPLRCLLMSGGEGSGNLQRIARMLLRYFNCEITVICGRNKRMRTRLEHALEDHGPRVRLLGFVENVQEYMMECDVAFMRGSPNSLMEAVVCNTPVLITGALPGQEARNPEYMVKHGLGVSIEHVRDIPGALTALLTDGAAGLNRIAETQRGFRNLDNAKDIAETINGWTRETSRVIPPFTSRFPAIAQGTELLHRYERATEEYRAKSLVKKKRGSGRIQLSARRSIRRKRKPD